MQMRSRLNTSAVSRTAKTLDTMSWRRRYGGAVITPATKDIAAAVAVMADLLKSRWTLDPATQNIVAWALLYDYRPNLSFDAQMDTWLRNGGAEKLAEVLIPAIRRVADRSGM
jgi:hypothetical protein